LDLDRRTFFSSRLRCDLPAANASSSLPAGDASFRSSRRDFRSSRLSRRRFSSSLASRDAPRRRDFRSSGDRSRDAERSSCRARWLFFFPRRSRRRDSRSESASSPSSLSLSLASTSIGRWSSGVEPPEKKSAELIKTAIGVSF
jgi:hypothetical protein